MNPTQPAKAIRLEHPVLIAASGLAIVIFLAINYIAFDVSKTTTSAWLPFGNIAFAQEADSTIMWRYTKQGWQDISPMIQTPPTPKSHFASVHPMVWGAMLLFASLALLVWSTDEADIHQLFGNNVATTNDNEEVTDQRLS